MRQTERLWSHKEAAAFLRVTPGTLYVWNSKRIGPPSHKVGHQRRYDPAELRAWVRAG